jgi:thiol-disulfide isomerase/thioredoxin
MNHIFKQLLFAIAFLLCVLFSHAQTEDKASQKSFGIDDKVPDMVLNDIINYPLKSVKLSSLMSGKMLLIDFWSTNCIACIEAFPKLMKLQEQFKDHLQVLMVTYQPHPVIKSFLEKREKITGLTLSLPTLCSDTILNNLFKHEFNPHCV